jgi:hypothetical protein
LNSDLPCGVFRRASFFNDCATLLGLLSVRFRGYTPFNRKERNDGKAVRSNENGYGVKELKPQDH